MLDIAGNKVMEYESPWQGYHNVAGSIVPAKYYQAMAYIAHQTVGKFLWNTGVTNSPETVFGVMFTKHLHLFKSYISYLEMPCPCRSQGNMLHLFFMLYYILTDHILCTFPKPFLFPRATKQSIKVWHIRRHGNHDTNWQNAVTSVISQVKVT